MKLRDAVCLNLSLNISESFIALRSICSMSLDFSIPGILCVSTLRDVPIMKLSSETVTETLVPRTFVRRYAYPRESASLTLLPKGKWKTSL